jgi:hypothetical protein
MIPYCRIIRNVTFLPAALRLAKQVLIGRDSACWCILSSGTSTANCRFFKDKFDDCHLESLNADGTFVNGDRCVQLTTFAL